MTRWQSSRPLRLQARQAYETEASSVAREAVYECIRRCENAFACASSRCQCPAADNHAIVRCIETECSEDPAVTWQAKLMGRCPEAFDDPQKPSVAPETPNQTLMASLDTATVSFTTPSYPTPTDTLTSVSVSTLITSISSETSASSQSTNNVVSSADTATETAQSLVTLQEDDEEAQFQSFGSQSEPALHQSDPPPTFRSSDIPHTDASFTSFGTSSSTTRPDVAIDQVPTPSTPARNPATIAGSVLGALAAVAICLVIYYLQRRHRNRKSTSGLMISSPVSRGDGARGADSWTEFKNSEDTPTFQVVQPQSFKVLASGAVQNSSPWAANSYIDTHQHTAPYYEQSPLRLVADSRGDLQVVRDDQEHIWTEPFNSPAIFTPRNRLTIAPSQWEAQSTRASSLDLAWAAANEARKSTPMPTRQEAHRSTSNRGFDSLTSRKHGSTTRQSTFSSRSGSTAKYTLRSGTSSISKSTRASRSTSASANTLPPPPPSPGYL